MSVMGLMAKEPFWLINLLSRLVFRPCRYFDAVKLLI